MQFFSRNMIDVNLLLEKGAVYKNADVGDVIFCEGASATHYFQLVRGKIRISNFQDDGKEFLHELMGEGECFGEFPLFDGECYAASAVADEPSLYLRLPADAFHELLDEHIDIFVDFAKHLAQKLRFKYFMEKIMSKNSSEQLLYELIDYYNKHNKYICRKFNRLLLTRQQLANMTGLRVETVIRAIKCMQKEDKLSIVKGKIFVPADGVN